MKLRFIIRDVKKILQSHPGKFGDWQDVPLVLETETKEEQTQAHDKDQSPCVHGCPDCDCRFR
jgi:hypothetical protein